jgi:hypothetical protein
LCFPRLGECRIRSVIAQRSGFIDAVFSCL